jgi:hypothetical protein
MRPAVSPSRLRHRTLVCRWHAVCLMAHLVLASQTLSARAEPIDPSMGPLIEQKGAMAAALAKQVAYCSSRRDTDHPVFKGCIDWHSAVHGIWALVAYERATGDRAYAGLVSSILAKDALQHERDHLRREPTFEMPYGRSWFLRLSIDHQVLTGSDDLVDVADEVALSILQHYRRNPVDRFSGSYDSASWALINLFDYARSRNRSDIQDEVAGWVRKNFVAVDMACPWDRERGHFMAVCTNWAALVSRVLERDEYAQWLGKFIEPNGLPSPVSKPVGAHHFGLNFSRAWGLWDIYSKTDRADVAKSYAAHLSKGYSPASNWRGDYGEVGHWVSQFGMFALQPLFGREKGR